MKCKFADCDAFNSSTFISLHPCRLLVDRCDTNSLEFDEVHIHMQSNTISEQHIKASVTKLGTDAAQLHRIMWPYFGEEKSQRSEIWVKKVRIIWDWGDFIRCVSLNKTCLIECGVCEVLSVNWRWPSTTWRCFGVKPEWAWLLPVKNRIQWAYLE